MTNEQYNTFLQAIYGIENLKRDRSEIAQSKEFQTLIYGIETLKADQIRRLSGDLVGIHENRIKKDLNTLFDPVFDNYSIGFCKKVKDITGNFFYIKKSFQLSHLDKIYSDSLSQKDEFGDYFFIQLYTDYFETLTNRLKGLYAAFFDDLEKKHYNSADQFYKKMLEEQSISILEEINLNDDLRQFRNNFSHGQFLCESRKVKIIKEPKKAISQNEETKTDSVPKSTYYPRFRSLMIFHILFSTEFDLRYMNLVSKEDFDDLDSWFEYYQIYKESWETQQRISDK